MRGQFMNYTSELGFFRKILKNLHISSYVTDGTVLPENIDHGIRHFLGLEHIYRSFVLNIVKNASNNVIYFITDEFMCNYILLLLPNQSVTITKEIFICGPFITADFTRKKLMERTEKYELSPKMFAHFEKYYGNIPLVTDEAVVTSLFNSFGEILWSSIDNFAIQRIIYNEKQLIPIDEIKTLEEKSEEALLTIQSIEARYEAEQALMTAVQQGLPHKVTHLINHASEFVFENRTEDSLRNIKNYLIVMNTLLRKAAQSGGVPPYFIDKLSSHFAKKIEAAAAIQQTTRLPSQMVEHYCRLVNENALNNYSMPVQKAIAMIDYDLTADLSLKAVATSLNINASYFSTLFKKETGKTLTEYVANKRIANAEILLSSTNLQIQTVAQHCGILDVNYFTKLFKKHTGTTPGKYRESKQ